MGHQPRAGADLDPRGDDAIGTNLGRCGSACARIDKGRRVDGTGVLQFAYAEFGRAADFGLVLGQRADAGDAQEGFQGLPGTRSGAVRIGLPLPAIATRYSAAAKCKGDECDSTQRGVLPILQSNADELAPSARAALLEKLL